MRGDDTQHVSSIDSGDGAGVDTTDERGKYEKILDQIDPFGGWRSAIVPIPSGFQLQLQLRSNSKPIKPLHGSYEISSCHNVPNDMTSPDVPTPELYRDRDLLQAIARYLNSGGTLSHFESIADGVTTIASGITLKLPNGYEFLAAIQGLDEFQYLFRDPKEGIVIVLTEDDYAELLADEVLLRMLSTADSNAEIAEECFEQVQSLLESKKEVTVAAGPADTGVPGDSPDGG